MSTGAAAYGVVCEVSIEVGSSGSGAGLNCALVRSVSGPENVVARATSVRMAAWWYRCGCSRFGDLPGENVTRRCKGYLVG